MKMEYEIELESDFVNIHSNGATTSIHSGVRLRSPEMLRSRIFELIYAEIANEIASNSEEYEGQKIEEKSLAIVDSLIPTDICGPIRHIVIKAVHASGDFSIAPLIRYSESFFESMLKKIIDGCSIICDSEMVRAGIYSRSVLERNSVVCYLNDARSREIANNERVTRSVAGIRIAMQEHRNSVIVIGNSPTALQEAMRIIEVNGWYDIPIVGIPVGFVNGSRVKDKLTSSRIEHITVVGHRGGSPIAASIVNGFGRFMR